MRRILQLYISNSDTYSNTFFFECSIGNRNVFIFTSLGYKCVSCRLQCSNWQPFYFSYSKHQWFENCKQWETVLEAKPLNEFIHSLTHTLCAYHKQNFSPIVYLQWLTG